MPRTATEALLLELWQSVLKRANIGITDNFFEVGGDSLNALRVAIIARRRGLQSFTLEALFTKPVFFFQAEDGIRGKLVTGVQTCALPISVNRKPSGCDAPRSLSIAAKCFSIFAASSSAYVVPPTRPFSSFIYAIIRIVRRGLKLRDRKSVV